MLTTSRGPVGEAAEPLDTYLGRTVHAAIGWTAAVIAALAAIGLAYGITAWRFGDCPGWECES